MQNPIVVYHIRSMSTICFDGFASATVCWRKFGDNAEYLKALYSAKIPIDRFADRDVMFVDFSYDVEYMDEINKVAKSLVVLDHHEPKIEKFVGRDYANFSNFECGAILTWDHLFPNLPVPDFLRIIDDGDRAVNQIADRAAFEASLSVEETSFKNWSKLMDTLVVGSDCYTRFLDRGQIVALGDNVRITNLVRDAFPITLCGITGLAVNSNKFFAHDAATQLATHSPFGAVFYLRSDGNVEVSLRRVDPDVDVFAIAESFGGGGHRGAAAFSVSLEKFSELLNRPHKADVYARIENATKTFHPTMESLEEDDSTENIEKHLYDHLRTSFPKPLVDRLDFKITTSVGHPNFMARIMSAVVRILHMPRTVVDPRWYHKLLPYKIRRTVDFDEDSIRNVLLESDPKCDKFNHFFVERLLNSINVQHIAELITSTHYVHVTVFLPDSQLTIKHTFEIAK